MQTEARASLEPVARLDRTAVALGYQLDEVETEADAPPALLAHGPGRS